MSIVVDLDELLETAERYPLAYLLTAGSDARVKSVVGHVHATADGDWRVVRAGRGSLANVRDGAPATLLYPPTEPGGYSLIVDADASCEGDDVLLAPTHAVLHRPADHAATGAAARSACGHDCSPVGERPAG